jgi:hypothetical protein
MKNPAASCSGRTSSDPDISQLACFARKVKMNFRRDASMFFTAHDACKSNALDCILRHDIRLQGIRGGRPVMKRSSRSNGGQYPVVGAEKRACIASLIETSRLNGVDPQACFTNRLAAPERAAA